MSIFENNDLFDVNAIRPTFNLHIIDKNASYVPINFTLPTEEITAFIDKIKVDIKKDDSIIKTPMELLGEELEKIEDAIQMAIATLKRKQMKKLMKGKKIKVKVQIKDQN